MSKAAWNLAFWQMNVGAVETHFEAVRNLGMVGEARPAPVEEQGLFDPVLQSCRSVCVRRGEEWHSIAGRELLLGDTITLRPGEYCPVDARVTEVKDDATLDLSSLTGDATPVPITTVALDDAMGPKVNMVYEGSCLVHGSVVAVVVAIGDETYLGKIPKDPEPKAAKGHPLSKSHRKHLAEAGVRLNMSEPGRILERLAHVRFVVIEAENGLATTHEDGSYTIRPEATDAMTGVFLKLNALGVKPYIVSARSRAELKDILDKCHINTTKDEVFPSEAPDEHQCPGPIVTADYALRHAARQLHSYIHARADAHFAGMTVADCTAFLECVKREGSLCYIGATLCPPLGDDVCVVLENCTVELARSKAHVLIHNLHSLASAIELAREWGKGCIMF